MSEQAPEATEATGEEQPQAGAEQEQPETFDREYVEKLRREAAENRTKLRAVEKAAEEERKARMTEAERAVEEAEARGRTTATQQYGQRLAKSEVRATAAAAGKDVDGVFDWLDISRFVTEDGEPDEKAIKSFVATLPNKEAAPVGFDGGARTAAPAPKGMTQIIRQATGRG